MKSSALFSECRTYRYALWRIWDESLESILFIGLNPSTADEIDNEMEVLLQREEYLEPKLGKEIKVENDDWVLIDYSGTIRPDHVPTMIGESNEHPGYEMQGRLFGAGYIRGLLDGNS